MSGGAYKCRGKLGKKTKATEMEDSNFSLALLTKKFADLCGEPVGLQYRGKTLLADSDVKVALDDCYAQKKLFLEVDLVAGGATAVAASAPPRTAAAAVAPAVSPARGAEAPEAVAVDEMANKLLSKYGLISPREGAAQEKTAVAEKALAQNKAPEPEAKLASIASPRRTVAVSSGSSGLVGAVESEVNRLRSSPQSFVGDLERRQLAFDGATMRLKRGNVMFRSATHEGAAAVAEALGTVRNCRAVPEIAFCSGLSEAAADIVTAMGPEGATKPSPEQMGLLIEARGEYEGLLSQVIAYIYEEDVIATVVDLLVCDGDASRHTAKLLLDPQYRFGGVAVSTAQGGPRLLVMQFVSDSWVDRQ